MDLRFKPEIAPWTSMCVDAPWKPGIYCVLSQGCVLYIGTSKQLKYRLLNHTLRDEFMRLGADEVRYMLTGHERTDKRRQRRLEMERWLLNQHKPVLNKQKIVPIREPKCVAEYAKRRGLK